MEITDPLPFNFYLRPMSPVFVRILGCGDAFCSGGRMQTCFHIGNGRHSMLLDCGSTVLLAMQQQKIDPTSIDHILLSHLHGDHFGGLPFLLMHAQFVAGRRQPLDVLGPEGTERRIFDALHVLFPDLGDIAWRFPLRFIELEAHREAMIGEVQVVPHLVDHPSGAPSLAFRLTIADKVLAFSGDTRWTEALVDIADDVDLLIAECHSVRPNGVHHLDWKTLNEHDRDLRARRILLTHMSQSMLDRLPEIERGRFEFAEDGLVMTL
jgi:ribonuclease BN (tRNA processing enzyme)